MSMSMHVTGFVPPDEAWRKMKAVWDACAAAGVPAPAAVEEFFGGEAPDEAGVSISLTLREWKNDGLTSEGYELDVAAIPPQATTLRFWCSW